AMSSRLPSAAALSNSSALFTWANSKCEPTCTGRSPVLRTRSVVRSRPGFSTTGSPAGTISPGLITASLPNRPPDQGEPPLRPPTQPAPPPEVPPAPALQSSYDRVVTGDELGAVGKGGLHLHRIEHLGDAVEHLRPRQHLTARRHQLTDGPAVPRPLHHVIGDERDRFGMVQPQPALQSAASDIGGDVDEKLVPFLRTQVHEPCLSPVSGSGPTGNVAVTPILRGSFVNDRFRTESFP